MPSMPIFALFPSLFVAAVFAAPQNVDTLGETFTLDQIPKGQILKNGPLAMARTYLKYGLEVPDFVSAAVANSAAAAEAAGLSERSVSATPNDNFDTLYLSPVTLGSDTLNLYLDSGSSDLYVSDTRLPNMLTCNALDGSSPLSWRPALPTDRLSTILPGRAPFCRSSLGPLPTVTAAVGLVSSTPTKSW